MGTAGFWGYIRCAILRNGEILPSYQSGNKNFVQKLICRKVCVNKQKETRDTAYNAHIMTADLSQLQPNEDMKDASNMHTCICSTLHIYLTKWLDLIAYLPGILGLTAFTRSLALPCACG